MGCQNMESSLYHQGLGNAINKIIDYQTTAKMFIWHAYTLQFKMHVMLMITDLNSFDQKITVKQIIYTDK